MEPQPASAEARNLEARLSLFRTLSAHLELRWQNFTPDLERAQFEPRSPRDYNRDYAFPDLSTDPDVVMPGDLQRGFISPPALLRENRFFETFSLGRIPDLTVYDGLRPQNPSVENDLLWGMMNPACVKALLCMASHIRPVNAVVIGGGVGYVESLLAQSLPAESRLTVVDCGDNTDQLAYPIPARAESYRRLLDGGNIFRFLKESHECGLVGNEHGHATVHLVTEDSRKFFSQATKYGRQFDFIVIDGNNAFANGALDILEGFESLIPGGILIIDDSNRLYAQSGVMRGAFLLGEAGVSVLNLEARGNTTLCDRHGHAPNMLIAAKRPDWRVPLDSQGETKIWALKASIAAEMRDLEGRQ